MICVKPIIILTLFLFFLLCKIDASTFGIFHQPFPNKNWIIKKDISDNVKSAYIACEQPFHRNSQTKQTQDCRVATLKHGTLKEDNICNITLKAKQENGSVGLGVDLFMFGDDKIVLIWKEEGPTAYFRIQTITPDSCKITENQISDESNKSIKEYKFTFYNKSFDVFFKNPMCGTQMCWMTMDNEGKVVHEPAGYYEAKDRNEPAATQRIDADAPEKGHVFAESNENGTDYFLRKPNDTDKFLAHSLESRPIRVSTANNLIGVCFHAENTTKCAQYDLDGKVKLETTVEDTIQWPDHVHNLVDGGLFLVYGYEENCRRSSGCPTFLVLKKIDANGQKIGRFLLDTICGGSGDSKPYMNFKFYQNEEGKYCLPGPCGGRKPLTTQCFDDTAFSK